MNPKNLTLCLAGGVSIGGAGLSTSETVVTLVVFVVIASSTVAVPVLGYLLARDRMAAPLDRLRDWLTANNAAVMSVLCSSSGPRSSERGWGDCDQSADPSRRRGDRGAVECVPAADPGGAACAHHVDRGRGHQEELQGVLNYLSSMGVRIVDVVTIPE